MANINITLRMNKINYNITSIVDTGNLNKEIEMEISTEGTFNTASFIIPAVERYELGPNIDFSRGILRNSLITIERDQVEYQWRVMGDTVAENQNSTYTHTINLIDRRSETTGINIPGLTLTQSKSERGEIINSISTINKSRIIGNGMYSYNDYPFSPDIKHGINITPSNPIIPLNTFIPSSDTNVVNGLVIKDVDGEREYNISLDMTLVNTQNYYNMMDAGGRTHEYYNQDIDYIVKLKANNNIIYSEPGTLLGGTVTKEWGGGIRKVNLTTTNLDKILKITPLVETTISVEIEVLSGNPFTFSVGRTGNENITTYPSTLSISDLSLSIFTTASDNPSQRSLEYWVDKILNSIYIDETPPYTLSSASRARLSQIVAPEFTIDGYNLYQAIQEVADFLGTSWEINNNDEIDFIFFDDTTIIDFDDEQKQTTTGVSDLSDYASAIQINAENIASNSIKKEYDLTVRAIDEGNARITTDNLMIKTEEPINYISKVVFKGIDLKDADGVTHSQDWNITSRVVTKEEWDILPSNFDPSDSDPEAGRNILMKNNTLYFIRGQKGLYGLSYVGGAKPTFIGNPNINRALFEVIAATARQSIGLSTTTKDGGSSPSEAGGIATQNALKVDIEYYPFVSSDINIYKDDQSGFQIERHKYFNESSRVNDPELLGKVAQNTVNRLGGTEYTTTGYLETLVGIPRLGTINSDNRRLTKLILQMTDAYIRYTATYISDYTKISKFVGKKSDYRLYEIPNTAVIESNRIKRNKLIFGSTKPLYNILPLFVRNLKNNKEDFPILAKLDFNHSLGTSTVYAGVVSNEFGKSASWKVKMPTNYSAGLKKVVRPSDESDPESDPVWFQEEVKYTDKMGTIDSVDIEYYSDYSAGDNYPAEILSGQLLLTTQHYDYDKDAREIFSIEYEVAFGSNNTDKYRIYDGITKYNSFINGRTDYTIECRVLDYIPNRNDVKVDLVKCKGIVNSVNMVDNKNLTVNTSETGQGLVFYDKTSLDILLVVKDTIPVGNYIIPFGAPENLIIRTVTFMENGGTSVPNQQVVNGTLIAEVLTTTSKTGYTFGGWYTESGFVNLFDFDTPITSNTTLYAKWINVSNHAWRRIYTTIVDEIIYPSIESFTCPLDYTSLLPSANDYNLNHVLEVIPVRQCDPENDTCQQDPITNEWYKLCPSQQFKVYDITDYTIYSGPLISSVNEDNLLSVYSGIQIKIYRMDGSIVENVTLNSYGLTVYDNGNIEVLFYEDGIYITNGLTNYVYGLPK